jgi:hypothetical protein
MFTTAVLLAASMVGGQANQPSEIPQELMTLCPAGIRPQADLPTRP